MKDQDKTKEQLLAENEELRRQLEGAIRTGEEIAKRKQIEEALRLSEGNYRAIFDAANDAIFVHDPETGAILDANPKATEMYGYTTGEFRQGRVEILSEGNPPYSQAEAMQWIGRAFSGLPQLFTWKSKHKTGHIFWTEVNLKRAVLNGATRLLAIVRDITERKNAEDALRTSEAKYRRLHQSMMDAFVSVDMDGHIQEYNDAYQNMLGYEPEELLALRYTDITPEKWRSFETQIVQNQIVPLGYSDTYEKEYRRKDGTDFPVELRTFLVKDDDGQPCAMWAIVRDITERKRAEEALKKAHDELEQRVEERTAELTKANRQLADEVRERRHGEERLALALEAGSVGLFDWDTGDRRPYWTPELPVIFGYEPHAGGMKAYDLSAWTERVHPDDLPWVEERVRASMAEHKPFQAEYRILHKDGSLRWVECRGRFFYEGKAPRMVGTVVDITERRREDAALRESEERLHAICASALDAVIMIDANGKVVYWNPAAEQIFGYTAEEMHGRDVHSTLVPVGYLEHSLKAFAEFTYSGQGNAVGRVLELTALRKNGAEFPIELALSAFKINNQWWAAAIVRDITERKQAQEALRQSEERYELAVRAAGVGHWDWNLLTGKVYYSPRWKTLFGYDESDIGDTADDWASLLHPDERDHIIKLQDEFFASTATTATAEYRFRHKDGSYRWIIAHVLAVRDEHGKAIRLVGSHGDITDRKQAQEALKREHETLKHLLQSSDHERQLIAYEIHDDLAQQLAGAIMQFQTFDHLKDKNPTLAAKAYDAGRTMLQQGHGETRRLIANVRHPILDEAGVVEAISHLVHEQSREKGPKIENVSSVDFDRLVPTLENAIYRICQEALANACQHSKSEKVRVSLTQHDDKVRIEVRDWGTGFDTKTVRENRFGLEGIRQRARLLGGKCSVRSKAGKGTRILVELPVMERGEE